MFIVLTGEFDALELFPKAKKYPTWQTSLLFDAESWAFAGKAARKKSAAPRFVSETRLPTPARLVNAVASSRN